MTIPTVGSIAVPASDLVLFNDTPPLYYKVSVSAAQPLFTWGKIRNAIDIASLRVDEAAADLSRQQGDLDREVERAYSSALLAKGSAEELARIREALGSIREDRQKSFTEGSITRETLLQAEADLAAIDARITDAEEGYRTALETLGMLTGLDPGAILLSSDLRTGPPAVDEEASQRKALESSSDLAAGRSRIGQAQKALEIARGSGMLLPDLSLAVSLDMDNGQKIPPSGAPNWMSDWEWNLAVSLGVRLNVFDGMEAAQKTARAENDLAMAGEAQAQQQKLLRVSVRRAVQAVSAAEADLRAKRARADYVEERSRNAQASAEAGLASRDDERGAAIQAGTARLDLLMARFTLAEALADLGRLTGERL
jgi:outer membrane protein TolC